MKNLLNEIKMTPTYLKQYASKTDARVGIEFELLATDIVTTADLVNNIMYSRARNTNDLRSIVDELKKYVTDRDTLDDLSDLFYKVNLEIRNQHDEYINTDSIAEYLENDPELANIDYDEFVTTTVKRLTSQDVISSNDSNEFINWFTTKDSKLYSSAAKRINRLIEKHFRQELYNIARDEVINQGEIFNRIFEDTEDIAIRQFYDQFGNVSELLDYFEVYVSFDDDDDTVMQQIADGFSKFTKIDSVEASSRYHGAQHHNGWRVEPDSSIKGDGVGVEIVSPPLTLEEMFNSVELVKEWALKGGYETNSTTGLHINVSVPNIENLDYIKLVVLLGDEHVLQQFGRESNSYARSAFDIMRSYADNINKSELPKLKAAFVNDIMVVSEKFTKSLTSKGKYVSVRLDDGYVEFRSPGGDWLNADIDKILDTVNRFATVLSIACDPDAFREEYRTKFYKLLSAYFVNDPIDNELLKYTAGMLTSNDVAARVQNLTIKLLVRRKDTVKFDQLGDPDWGETFIVSPANLSVLAAIAQMQVVVVADDIASVKAKYPNTQVFPIGHPRIPDSVRQLVNQIRRENT